MGEVDLASWEEDIVTAFENLGGTASLSSLYREIERIRPDLPTTFDAIVRRRVQDLSSDSDGYKHGRDLFFSVDGKGQGVWGLRSQIEETPKAVDLPSPGSEVPERSQLTTYRILRDTVMARKVKLMHNNRCQICGDTLFLADGKSYAEAHHIRPLGRPHNGPDTPDNILVLCPNDHVRCDMGAVRLDTATLITVEGHTIAPASIEYHNTVVHGSRHRPVA